MDRPKVEDWMWVAVLIKPGLIEMVLECDLKFEHLYAQEALPERVQFRRMVLVNSKELEGGRTSVSFHRPPSLAGSDLVGVVKTNDWFSVSEVDPMILRNAKEMFGIKSIDRDVSKAPENLRKV